MSLFTSIKKRSTLDAAIKQVAQARKSEGGLAEQLYKGAYQGFASVALDHPMLAETLYHWGFALLHEAKTQTAPQNIASLEDAISKFSFCLLIAPNYLGAAIDGGVAYMELALLNDDTDKIAQLRQKAQQAFEQAEAIQKGSAAYNLACIFAIKADDEACLKALTLAKESGSLPDAPVIMQDTDMQTVIEKPWFTEFMENAHNKPDNSSRKLEKESVDYNQSFIIKKSEDFDYYS